MLFTNERHRMREVFYRAWAKAKANEPLLLLEQEVVEVIGLHPEYHKLLNSPLGVDQDDWGAFGGENPFFHMALHLSLKEQISTNRPAGIQGLYYASMLRLKDHHHVQHRMMKVLAKALKDAQAQGRFPEESAYLKALFGALEK